MDIKRLKIEKTLLKNRYLAYILVPAIMAGGGYTTGRVLSNNINQYKTITRIYDGKKGNLIEEIERYDEKGNDDVITVLQYEPWEEVGNFYYRIVNAYDYDTKLLKEKNYCINELDMDKIKSFKYSYVVKEKDLSEEELDNNNMLLIQETTQDKNNVKKTEKYILPACITSSTIGIIMDLIIYFRNYLDSDTIKNYLKKIEEEINNYEKYNKIK